MTTMLEFWRGRRVFVTGHTGFKGAWLCLLLRRLGAHVAGYALSPPTRPSLFELARVDELVVSSTIADVRDGGRLEAVMGAFEPEVVLHLAAQSVVLESYLDPVNTYSSNVMGTVNVLEAIRRLGRRVTMVNVTTDKCYQNRGGPRSYSEIDALGGRDPYSNSKACSELVTQAYRHSFFPLDGIAEHGVALASARAGNVIGGGDWTPHQLVPMAIAAFSRGETVALRHPSAVRPWHHVLDCLSGYLAVAEATTEQPGRFSGEWNLGPLAEDVYTVAQVAEALAGHWGLTPAWSQAPGGSPHEELDLRLDCSKARRQLGWNCRLSTRLGIDWVADWHRRIQSGTAARDVCMAQIDAYLELGGSGRDLAGSSGAGTE
jgi:CDP-glucose 4,6-dehydratase